MEKPSYTAVVLFDKDRANLLSRFPAPVGWRSIAHHMTINMGAAKWPNQLGQKVTLKVIALGQNERVMAVKVETPVASTNQTKHITIAVNTSIGAKPVESNFIQQWNSIEPFELQGWITEVAGNGTTLQSS